MYLDDNVPEDKFFIEDSIEFVTKVYGGSSDDWIKTKGKKEMDEDGRYSFHLNFIRFNDSIMDYVSITWKQTEDKSDFSKGASIELIPFKNIFSITMIAPDYIRIFPNSYKRKTINLEFDKIRTCFSFLNNFQKYFNESSQMSSKISNADEIKKYKELLDDGTITEDEFNAFKKKLLE